MNKKKWQRKFARRDSRRFLKHHEPYYSDPYRREKMPPIGKWIGKARDVTARYPENVKKYCAYGKTGYRIPAEAAAISAMQSRAGLEMAAVEAAIAETRKRFPKNATRKVELVGRMYWGAQSMEQARKAVNVSRETAEHWDFYFLRYVAWHLGIHYNHTGRNRYGYTRKANGFYR